MGDGSVETWGAYIKRMVDRPGWSVARLAREAGIHRATIFGWIKDDTPSLTVASVRAIAQALGDDIDNALRAAGNVEPENWEDRLAKVQQIANNPDRTPGLRAWAAHQVAQIEAILEAARAEEETDRRREAS